MKNGKHYPLFMHLCWFLNSIRLFKISAYLRYLVFAIVFNGGETLWVNSYDNPDEVGYNGWVEWPGFGVLAFVKRDGQPQFEW